MARLVGRIILFGGLAPFTLQVLAGTIPRGLDLAVQGHVVTLPGEFDPEGDIDFTLQATSANGLVDTLRIYLPTGTDQMMPMVEGLYVLPRLIPPGTLTLTDFIIPTEIPG